MSYCVNMVNLLCVCDLLFVPVIDLHDVAEDDLVLALHVLRDSLLPHLAHIPLERPTQSKADTDRNIH